MRQILKTGATIVALTASAGALASPALTRAPAGMREGPSPNAPVVQHVPANTEIDVHSCQGAWCYTSWRDIFGYLPNSAIDPRPYPGSHALSPGPYGDSPVVVAPVFGFGWSFGPGWRGRW